MRPHSSYIPRTRDAETDPKRYSEYARWMDMQGGSISSCPSCMITCLGVLSH